MRFLLDEHVSPLFAVELMRNDSELLVLAIGDEEAPPRGTLDPGILLWCEAHGFMLITNNRKTMPNHLVDHLAAGCHIEGIITFDEYLPFGEVLERLLLLAGASFEGEYRDRITFLPQ